MSSLAGFSLVVGRGGTLFRSVGQRHESCSGKNRNAPPTWTPSLIIVVLLPLYHTDGLLQVRDSALRPLDGDCWWKDADSPWQCLAVCTDLTAALDSPDPTEYLSCLPVHQDGEMGHGGGQGGGAKERLVCDSLSRWEVT